jgi:glyoxylase-like metal-dependent hydrolase (beta-lactamase superfamily II)
MEVQLLVCGYCDGKEHHVLKGGRRKTIKFPALTALIKHPENGYILFDTGYTNRFYEETKGWPGKIYAAMTPTHVKEEEYLVNQLAAKGIQAEEINYIIISHFHGDHICGMKDFSNAKFICSKEAFDNVQKVKDKPWKAIFQGVLPGLLPEDFGEERVWIYDSDSNVNTVEEEILGKCHDLFGDGLIQMIPLPGHHYGQIGVLLQTNKGPLLLAADACWLGQAYKENRLPAGITKLLLSDWKAFKESLHKLHLYHKAHPELPIIPTHCEATQADYPEFFEG